MSDAEKDAELRRLLARTCTELLAKNIKHTMAVPVIRGSSDLEKKSTDLTQSLWALPGLWSFGGMQYPLYLSDTAEIVHLAHWTLGGHFVVALYTVLKLKEHQATPILQELMELRESHGLES